MADEHRIWDQATDIALIERFIASLQRAAMTALAGADHPTDPVALPAPELATALLNLLASILEPAPQCAAPNDMRRVSEAAGKELLVLMRGFRQLSRPAKNEFRH